MNRENIIPQLADFVARTSYEDLSAEAKRQIKVRVLDWLGCAIGAIRYEPMRSLRNQIEEFGGKPLVTMIGGGKTSPDRAAFYNGALTQHLGFNDSFLSGKRRCHPSNSLPAILAASEYAGASGMEFLTALAVAYQVHCRLCEVMSEEVWRFVRSTPGSYAVAAGVAKALKLKQEQTANAIAAATATSRLEIADVCAPPQCQAVYYPESAFFLAQSAFHAMSSISDTSEAIGSSSAWLKSTGSGLDIDWSKEKLDAVCRTAIKKFNAEGHAQSALEAILYLRERQPAPRHWIERIELDTFDVAFNLLSNDGWGNEYRVSTKAEAYRSLPYLLAVALLDGEVGPSQYEPERILREDVQSLRRKVKVRENGDFSRRFPEEQPARVQIILRDGKILCREKHDYEGYVTRPFTWQRAVDKFRDLTVRHIGYQPGQRIIETVLDIEKTEVRELTELLAGTVMIPKEQTEEKVFYLQNYKLAA